MRTTVFATVSNDMAIAREEIFRPVLAILPYRTEEEAIGLANDTNYGLAAYLQSSNLERARAIASSVSSRPDDDSHSFGRSCCAERVSSDRQSVLTVDHPTAARFRTVRPGRAPTSAGWPASRRLRWVESFSPSIRLCSSDRRPASSGLPARIASTIGRC